MMKDTIKKRKVRDETAAATTNQGFTIRLDDVFDNRLKENDKAGPATTAALYVDFGESTSTMNHLLTQLSDVMIHQILQQVLIAIEL
jgi:hypothetical protein